MAISHIGTNTAFTGSGGTTSVTVTKPASTTQGDLLLAFFTSNNQDCTAPAGWTEIADTVVEVFRLQVFYKVAGSSEPVNYTFSITDPTILVCTVSTFRGIDQSSPIDISPVTESDLTHGEPYTTPGLTGGTGGRLLYVRSSRDNSTTPITYTASGVTELSDVGEDNGSLSYSHGVYMANADYIGSGVKSGLAITASSSETHNVVLTMAIKVEPGPTGTMAVQLPSLPGMSAAGDVYYSAALAATMPLPTASISAHHGTTEGTLGALMPLVTASVAGNIPTVGTFGVVVMPVVDISGETRFFSDNVVIPDREERWLVITQDGYYLGVRTGVDLPMRIQVPLPVVNITASTVSHAEATSPAEVTAFEPSEMIVTFTGAAAAVTAEAYGATVLNGRLAFAEEVVLDTTSAWEDASIGIVFSADTVVAASAATEVIGASALAGEVGATVSAFGAVVGNAKQASAGHASVSIESFSIVNNVNSAFPGTVSAVTATANAPRVTTKANSGHVSVSCHN